MRHRFELPAKALTITAALFLLLGIHARSQTLSVDLKDLDFRDLPRVTFTACVAKSDSVVPILESQHFTIIENGIPYQAIVRCPPPSKINSVALVMDNSGSINPGTLEKLKESGKILVDSLGAIDEAAVIRFTNAQVIVEQDFTTNKGLLKFALDRMQAQGGTPLFDASFEAVQRLALRDAKRFAVILTDGEDTQSSLQDVQPIIDLANVEDVKLFTIGFQLTSDKAIDAMKRMAIETGGLFFDVQRPSELTEIYEQIASLITEPCCVGEYVSNNCSDSVRTIQLNVEIAADFGSDTETLITPYRPDEFNLTIDVPDDLTPAASGTGYIYIDPVPHPDLELTLSFVVEFDENLIDITPRFPLTLGTVTQNHIVNIRTIERGKVRFELERVKPSVNTNRLVGFPVQAQRIDSSRLVEFSIDSSIVEITGCHAFFTTDPDTTSICQCFRELSVQYDRTQILDVGEESLLPIVITQGLVEGMGAQLRFEIEVPEELELVEILNGDLFPDGTLFWTREGEKIYFEVPDFAAPFDTSGVLALLRLRAPTLRSATSFPFSMGNRVLLQECCPMTSDSLATTVLVDGLCDKIVMRRPGISVSTMPNPVSTFNGGQGTIRLHVPGTHADREYTISLTGMHGDEATEIRTLYLTEGDHELTFNTSGLSSGKYILAVTGGGEMFSHNIIVVK
ncbi:MAG: hypothetical protein CL946_03275 [Ectothiorhodospiraceae bacterium]|nr:hypothetical protein [Ectothiorhodospiraceae bacterium]